MDNLAIRKMTAADKKIVVDMMRRFYNSPALITSGSEEIYAANVDNCTGGSNFVDGYVFEVDGAVVGYGMVAKSYSTEFGGECVWIEDIYVEAEYRGRGIGTEFIRRVIENYPDKILRLEAEGDNSKAVAFYRKFGFKELPYLELILARGESIGKL